VISQGLSLTDSSIQDALSSIIKTISDNLEISDGAVRVKGKLKTVSDNLGLSSVTQKGRPFIIRTISQTLNLSDSSSRMRLLIFRGFSQNLGLSSTTFKSVKSAIKQFTMKIRRLKKFRI